MPAATNRNDLSAVTAKEFGKLDKLISELDSDLALRPFEDGITIKDTIAHRAHWIELFFGWYADGQAGREVALPAPGYKWNELKRYNADLRAAQAGLSWQDAVTLLRANHARLMEWIEARDDGALYGGPMPGGGNAWPPGRWAEAAGPSHYRSAAKWIRKCLRKAG